MLITEIVDPTILKDLIPKNAGTFITDEKKMIAWLKKSGLSVALPTFENGKVSAYSVRGSARGWSHFLVEWDHIKDDFNLCGNSVEGDLRTLIGGPSKVGGHYLVADNQIYSLEGAPKEIGDNCDLSGNRISSLEHSPKEIGGYFNVGSNRLESLEHGPTLIGEGYYCSNNKLRSLKGAPSKINGSFWVHSNLLTDISGLPTHINGDLMINQNQITTLAGIDKIVKYVKGEICIGGNPITSSILGLMRIEGCTKIVTTSNDPNKDLHRAATIINKYLGKGKQGILEAQQELIDADLDDFADF